MNWPKCSDVARMFSNAKNGCMMRFTCLATTWTSSKEQRSPNTVKECLTNIWEQCWFGSGSGSHRTLNEHVFHVIRNKRILIYLIMRQPANLAVQPPWDCNRRRGVQLQPSPAETKPSPSSRAGGIARFCCWCGAGRLRWWCSACAGGPGEPGLLRSQGFPAQQSSSDHQLLKISANLQDCLAYVCTHLYVSIDKVLGSAPVDPFARCNFLLLRDRPLGLFALTVEPDQDQAIDLTAGPSTHLSDLWH